ncbi:MAG: type II toxin-antitoxin system RelE/ParE family toxin [Muribaculaceae bacterium]|nr:type II toxin-antitoxin system RelE/ParE family toxin [Muribaculaceae bacterium]
MYYLKELFEEGKTQGKKYRFQPQIIKAYQKVVRILITSQTIETLWNFKSLHYEVLVGDKKGISSVKINNQYRLEFEVIQNNDDVLLTVCNLLEISNHYS